MSLVTLQTLPVEIIATILSLLDVGSLIEASSASKYLRLITSDPILNPWRAPILESLLCVGTPDGTYAEQLRHLSVLSTVPRSNWLEILSIATVQFLLFQATLPNLSDAEWHEAVRRRFLPSWQKWNRGGRWRETFMKYVVEFICNARSSVTPTLQVIMEGVASSPVHLHHRRIVD